MANQKRPTPLQKKLTPIAEKFCMSSNGKWKFGEYIAEGNSAAVFSVRTDSQSKALKIYDPIFFEGEEGKKSLHRVEAHKPLIGHSCPYLIDIEEAGVFEATAFVMMEFLPWSELADELGKIPEKYIGSIIDQLAKAASFLDRNNICHRDIKPENIAISDDKQTIKLLDLGILRSTSEEEGAGSDNDGRKPFIGTVQYSSPEYLVRKEEKGEKGFQALTFYQIGAVLHDLIMGTPLFGDTKDLGNKYRLQLDVMNTVPEIKSSSVEGRYVTLARDCLEKDPLRRLALVNWARFDLQDKNDSDFAASLNRYGISLPQPRRIVSNADREGHKLALDNVGRALEQTIGDIRQKQKLPGGSKECTLCEYTENRRRFTYIHNKGVSRAVNVSIDFQITGSVEADKCEINILPKASPKNVVPVCRASLSNPMSDFSVYIEEITEKVLLEYVTQIEAAENAQGEM